MIIAIEGSEIGTEEKLYVKSIVDVEVDKRNVIVAYLVNGMGWKSKAEVIELIGNGRVDAVLVEEKDSIYIRTRPDGEIPNNLEEKKPKKR